MTVLVLPVVIAPVRPVGAEGATVSFNVTTVEAEETADLNTRTRYEALVVSATVMFMFIAVPVAVDCAAVETIAGPTFDQVVPPSTDVCGWKLVSLFEASTQDKTAVVVLDRLTATAAGGVGPVMTEPTSDTCCVPAGEPLTALSSNVNVPEVTVPEVGLKVTLIEQLAPDANVVEPLKLVPPRPQLLV